MIWLIRRLWLWLRPQCMERHQIDGYPGWWHCQRRESRRRKGHKGLHVDHLGREWKELPFASS